MKIKLLVIAAFFITTSIGSFGATLAGKFSCILNKDLRGFEQSIPTTSANTKQMIWNIDFSSNTIDIITLNIENFGLSNVNTSSGVGSLTLTTATGPITNSHIITIANTSTTAHFLAMPVNSGNTLFISYPYNDSNSEPGTAICQKE